MKNEKIKIKNDLLNLSVLSMRERGLRTFSGISPARYSSVKDSHDYPLSPMPFNPSVFASSSSSSFSSPVRYDKNGNYINNKNKNNDNETFENNNYNNHNNYNNYNGNYNTYSNYDTNNIEMEFIDISSVIVLKDIEEHSSFEDVIYFRTLAEKDLELNTDNGQHPSWLFKVMSW